MTTGARFNSQREFVTSGFTLKYPDDDVMVLLHEGEQVAVFSQAGATESSLQLERIRHMVNCHGWRMGVGVPPPVEEEDVLPFEPVEEKTPDDVVAEDIPDLNALFRVCFYFWQMQPDEVCRRLGYKDLWDAHFAGINPWQAFLTIKKLKQEKMDDGKGEHEIHQ
jgi:hypothetical protein